MSEELSKSAESADSLALEKRELEGVVGAGHRSSNTMGAAMVGVVLLAFIVFVYYRTDRSPGAAPWRVELEQQVSHQAVKDDEAARGLADRLTPVWPMRMYERLREDAFVAAGFALLLAYLFLLRERARARRAALLVHRDLERRIEIIEERLGISADAHAAKAKDNPDRDKPSA